MERSKTQSQQGTRNKTGKFAAPAAQTGKSVHQPGYESIHGFYISPFRRLSRESIGS